MNISRLRIKHLILSERVYREWSTWLWHLALTECSNDTSGNWAPISLMRHLGCVLPSELWPDQCKHSGWEPRGGSSPVIFPSLSFKKINAKNLSPLLKCWSGLFCVFSFLPSLHNSTAEVDILIFMTHSLMNAILFQ